MFFVTIWFDFCYVLQSDSYNDEIQPKKRLEDVIHLAELCIEVLQQNEEHHAEVIISLTPTCSCCCRLTVVLLVQ